MKKSLAELIDELTIVNIKIFMLIEKVEEEIDQPGDAKKIQTLNKYRSQLKNAINEEFGERQEIKV